MMYRAAWPILDQDRRLEELTLEATDDLAVMADAEGYMVDPAHPIQWHIEEGHTPVLTAVCAVREVRSIEDLYGRGRAA